MKKQIGPLTEGLLEGERKSSLSRKLFQRINKSLNNGHSNMIKPRNQQHIKQKSQNYIIERKKIYSFAKQEIAFTYPCDGLDGGNQKT